MKKQNNKMPNNTNGPTKDVIKAANAKKAAPKNKAKPEANEAKKEVKG
jgi:hypothetical protein